jgi:hypothetical protein
MIKKLLPLLLLLVAVVITLCPFFQNQLVHTDDSEFHAARSANYYLAFKQGQLPVRWAPNLSDHYGYPVFMFMYQLPYAIVAALYAVTQVPFQLGMNLVFAGSMLAGCIGMWLWAKQRGLTAWPATLAAALYIFAPYSLINIFARGAFGEVMFFGVFPWIFIVLEPLILNKPHRRASLNQIILIILIAALPLIHPTSLLVAAPLIVTYVLFSRYTLKQKFSVRWIIQMSIIVGIAGLLSAWFWLPTIAEKKYIALNNHTTVINYWKDFSPVSQTLFPHLWNNEFTNTKKTVAVGYPILVVVISTVVLLLQKRIAHKKEIYFWLAAFLSALLLTFPLSRPIWDAIPSLQYMQFPWRMLWLTTFAGTMLFVEVWKERKPSKKLAHIWMGVLSIMLVLSAINYSQYRGTQQWPDYELLEYFKQASSYNEHQPIWAGKFTAKYPDQRLSLRLPGKTFYNGDQPQPATFAQVMEQNWSGSEMQYVITTDKAVEVIQKTYYFPGWKVWVDGKETPIRYEDVEFPGHIIFTVSDGEHTVRVQFTNDTVPRKIGDALFPIGVVAFLAYSIYVLVPRKKYL